MSPRRPMSAADAQMLWMSAKIPNDQFLLYAFAGSPPSVTDALTDLRRNADACGELGLRIADDCSLRYPRWVSTTADESQCVVHSSGLQWQECLDAVEQLALSQLDPREITWRAHVFPNVVGIPGGSGGGTVVVIQIVHSLGDGTRSADLAGALFGRGESVPVVDADRGWLLPRAVAASRTHRQLMRDVDAGLVPTVGSPRPVVSVNRQRSGRSTLRTFLLDEAKQGCPTVTVRAMVAISEALGNYLSARGEDISHLGAEVPMRSSGPKNFAHNNFRNVSVGLYPEVGWAERAQKIADELGMHRRRGEHPAMAAARQAFAATPAPLLRWGVRQFDPSVRSPVVAGNTVVSSVNRGSADLSFGGCPVVLTSGYPSLSPMQSLTHGIHGIGGVIAVSVNADPANVDVDEYVARLQAAFRR